MFGSHLSAAGGVVNALTAAAEAEMECVQVFTRNQRQWKAKPLEPEEIAAFRDAADELGWLDPAGPARMVSHNSYLVNFASRENSNREKSIAAQRAELERCEQLGITLCVAHPGAHLGAAPPRKQPLDLTAAPTDDETAGLTRIARSLDRLHRDLPGYRVLTCLETTAGTGTNLGYAAHHLAAIRDMVAEPERIAFCVDTCHITAAGYDLSTDDAAAEVIGQFDSTLGLDSIRVWHMNDSIGACGSRTDRHTHIGDGECGLSCFRAVVNHPAFVDVPKILETPKDGDDDGVPWDQINIARLKGLVGGGPARR